MVGSIQGDVFVWTSKGRPEVVGSFYKWYAPFTHRTNEFVSRRRPRGRHPRRVRVWAPSRAGVELKPIPEAPPLADSPAQGSARSGRWRRSSPPGRPIARGVDRDLRLLSQPLYRYEKTEGDLVDGALFAFTLGTDPEALLFIEARVVDGPLAGITPWPG